MKFKLAKAALMTMAVMAPPAFSALYEVTEIDTTSLSRHAFVADINANGDIVFVASYDANLPLAEHNIPINLSLIDFENESLAADLTDIFAARNGDFNATDFEVILRYLSANQASDRVQPLTPWLSYTTDGNVLSYIPAFDEERSDYNGFTKTVETRVQAINDNGVVVGVSEGITGPIEYTEEDGTEVTYQLRQFGTRGFVQINGMTVGLPSDVTIVGGYSEALGVNNKLQVVGSEMVAPLDSLITFEENCSDEDFRSDAPLEDCLNNVQNTLGGTNPRNFRHRHAAVVWQLDTEGNITSKTSYGVPIELDEDEDGYYASEAVDINENGIAVGSATNLVRDDANVRSQYAAIFADGEITSLTDRNTYISSSALAINDNNIVAGVGARSISGVTRTKFFYHNMETGETTFPDDFFASSSSVARAINNNGLIVGEGEADTNPVGRTSHGFLYDTNDDTFRDINDLLGCDQGYLIVQARGINDSDQIAALARVRRPLRNPQGDIVTADDGSETLIDTFVTVRLDPVPGGTIDNCSTPPPIDDDNDSSGGSAGFWLLLVVPSIWLRRKRLR